MNRWMTVCALFALLAFAGCGSDGSYVPQDAHAAPNSSEQQNGNEPTGSITVTWPTSLNAAPRALDSATEWFRVKVEEGFTFSAFADLTSGTSTSISAIPAGPVVVHVTAWDGLATGLPTLLSYRSADVTVVGGTTTPVTVTLAPSSATFTQPTSMQYAAPTTVELTFTNWPLELRQTAIDIYLANAALDGLVFDSVCSVSPTNADNVARSCVSAAPLTDHGLGVGQTVFVAFVHGDPYARDFADGRGMTLFPQSAHTGAPYVTFISGGL